VGKRRFALVIAVVVLTSTTLPGCYWPPPPPSADVNVTIDTACDVGSDEIDVMPGDRVRFCNNNECLVTILFESNDLFGRDSVRIYPGSCVVLRVRSETEGHNYDLQLDCGSCDVGGGHTSPEVKVGGGGP
jgi:hypothetical protein